MVLVQGGNGQGKSNLLEAIYMLAVAKSPRASTDREVVRMESVGGQTFSRVAATVRRGSEDLRVQIDLLGVPPSAEDRDPSNGRGQRGLEGLPVQKLIKVNGVQRRAADLVGHVNAVMFGADDLELVYGRPAGRRRYMDMLISQLDNRYLKALQRYQRVLYQRNQLLKSIRQGRAGANELDFWNDELVKEGQYLIAQRAGTVRTLASLAGAAHGGLAAGAETLDLVYRPNVSPGDTAEPAEENMRRTMEASQERELAQGVTVVGPHRDDLQILIDGMEAAAFASRGQSRTAVLALKLAEAQHLGEQRRQKPVLLLDDILSELDARRRAQVLDAAASYEQCFITTTDVDAVGDRFLGQMARFVVRDGRVEAEGSGSPR